MIYLGTHSYNYSYYKFTISLLTVLDLFCPASSSLSLVSSLSLSLILRSMVSRAICLGIKHPSGAYDQIFIIVRLLRVCLYGALSLTRGRVCRLLLLLALASAVIFGSEFCGTRDHILLSQIRDFLFRRLLRLAGLRWKYSIQPPHGDSINWLCPLFIASHQAETPRF
jgi:hypothetical protein